MKGLISVIAGVLTAFGIFYLDSLFINWIISEIPKSAEEWYGIIAVVLWIFAISWTVGIAIVMGMFIGSFVRAILD